MHRDPARSSFLPRLIPCHWSRSWLVLVATALLMASCSATVKDTVMPFEPDAIKEAKSLLQNYASGRPVGSEVDGFEDLVRRVTQADQEKGQRLKQFLDSIIDKGRPDRKRAEALLNSL